MRARQGLGSGYETFKYIKAPYFPKPTRFLWEIAAIRSPTSPTNFPYLPFVSGAGEVGTHEILMMFDDCHLVSRLSVAEVFPLGASRHVAEGHGGW